MLNIKKYFCEITAFENPIKDIYNIRIKSLDKSFRYLPGQYLHLSIDDYDPSYGWPDSRCFSMRSNPSEELIRITFSVKGSFTSRMVKELEVGNNIYLKMPYGDFFKDNLLKLPATFIAGGTGISPFLSLFTDKLFKKIKSPKLFFGLKSREFNIYSEDLEKAKENNPELESYFFFEDEQGRMDAYSIIQNSNIDSAFYISGPPLMIKSFRNNLLSFGVNHNQIISDEWE